VGVSQTINFALPESFPTAIAVAVLGAIVVIAGVVVTVLLVYFKKRKHQLK